MFPRIAVSGGPEERGRSYGEQARDRIQRSIEIYADAFMYRAGWDWRRVRTEAETFVPRITAFSQGYLGEMQGIATGAGLDLLDVVALNVRTEIFFRSAECTAFAFVDPVTHRPLLGQNWDWLAATTDSVVILEAECEGEPSFVTVTEAGLLAKLGMNSAGLALLTNALATDEVPPPGGIPYHVLLRALLARPDVESAVELLRSTERASAANYLLVDDRGAAVDLEVQPGCRDEVHEIGADGGVLVHTNHFISPGFRGRDEMLAETPDSLTRLERLRAIAAAEDDPLGPAFLRRAFADHDRHPVSICAHHDPAAPPAEQWETIASVIVDLPGRRLQIAAGNPCDTEFEELTFGALLDCPAEGRGAVLHP